MSDLTRREDVLEEVSSLEFAYSHHKEVTSYCERLKTSVAKIPPVDAVEVVRCKDCDYMTFLANGTITNMVCTLSMMCVGERHFCSDGERKENETD